MENLRFTASETIGWQGEDGAVLAGLAGWQGFRSGEDVMCCRWLRYELPRAGGERGI